MVIKGLKHFGIFSSKLVILYNDMKVVFLILQKIVMTGFWNIKDLPGITYFGKNVI